MKTPHFISLNGKKVCIISFTPVFDEPRVCRQAQVLWEAGAHVTVIGYRGKGQCPNFWNFIALDDEVRESYPQASSGSYKGFVFILNKFMNFYYRTHYFYNRLKKGILLLLSRFSKRAAFLFFWKTGSYQKLKSKFPKISADLYIAHDYFTLPFAYFLNAENKGKIAFDAHEHATTQYAHSRRFRWLEAPYIDSLQHFLFKNVHCFSTVCDGIADLLQKDYHLLEKPLVIRSTPFYKEFPFKTTDPSHIVLLYHGALFPMRGLEEVIESTSLWNPPFKMIIRGPGDKVYIQKLEDRIQQLGVSHKIRIEPPIPFSDLISKAHEDADIGYFAQPQISPQKCYTLPNKFFEYTMAGLCLIVNKGHEIKKICDTYHHGVFVDSIKKEDIARCINALTPEYIDECKKNALHAAKKLCFEHESVTMISTYASLF